MGGERPPGWSGSKTIRLVLGSTTLRTSLLVWFPVFGSIWNRSLIVSWGLIGPSQWWQWSGSSGRTGLASFSFYSVVGVLVSFLPLSRQISKRGLALSLFLHSQYLSRESIERRGANTRVRAGRKPWTPPIVTRGSSFPKAPRSKSSPPSASLSFPSPSRWVAGFLHRFQLFNLTVGVS